MTTPSTFHGRLSFAMEARGATHAHIAAKFGKARSTVTHWATGRSAPDLDTLASLADELRVRRAWLAVGDGPMSEGEASSADSDSHVAAPSSATTTQHDGTPTSNAA